MSISRHYKVVKSLRREQQCPHCMHYIGVGESAIKWAERTLDGFYENYCHDDCCTAGQEYHKLYKQMYNEDLYDSHYWQLHYIDTVFHVWLTAKYPDVATRLNIAIDPNIGKTYNQPCVVYLPLKAGDVVHLCSPQELGWQKLREDRTWFTPEGTVLRLKPDVLELIVVKHPS